LSGSRVTFELLSNRQILEGCAQTHTIDGLFNNILATSVDLADQALAISVNDKTKKIGAHVMTTLFSTKSAICSHGPRLGGVRKTYKIIQSLTQMRLIKINIDIDQTLKFIVRLSNQQLTIRTINPSISVVDSVILALFARRSLQINSCLRDPLEGSESKRASLDGIGRGNDIGIGVGDVGVWVRVLQSCGVGVEGPTGDVDLFAFADGVGLEERTGMVSSLEHLA
jgi:hypothetical protein